jgi:(2R)-3-sulfolactate dehydrogenase (NADP+)
MENATVRLMLHEVEALTQKALTASGATENNALPVAKSVGAAEAEGVQSHGLLRVPTYCDHLKCGKVNGKAKPTCSQVGPSALLVDACDGFAHPAIDLGLANLVPLARKTGIAALGVTNSYNCGVVGYHVGRIAEAGLIALSYVNAPASMAPWGGRKAVFGTNPMSCAVPRRNAPALIIDQSSSVVARGEVMVAAEQGKPIPLGWALDKNGKPTTDPREVLEGGTMAPMGGYKGSNIALVVEILAAALTGASLSMNASSFANNAGGPPRTGQFFIAINPDAYSGSRFSDQVEAVLAAILAQEGTQLPCVERLEARKRTAAEGITISKNLFDKIKGHCGG